MRIKVEDVWLSLKKKKSRRFYISGKPSAFIHTFILSVKNKSGEVASFEYYSVSTNKTDNVTDEMLWEGVGQVANMYYMTSENYPTLNDFCTEFQLDVHAMDSKEDYDKMTQFGDKFSTMVSQEWADKILIMDKLTQ